MKAPILSQAVILTKAIMCVSVLIMHEYIFEPEVFKMYVYKNIMKNNQFSLVPCERPPQSSTLILVYPAPSCHTTLCHQ